MKSRPLSVPFRSGPPRPPARRAWEIGRGTALAGALGAALLSAWAGLATWYVLRPDTIAARLLAQQAALQTGYEEEIGRLRGRLDRASSRRLLDQDALERRVVELASRQARLEAHQAQLALLAREADPFSAAVRKPDRGPDPPPAASAFAPLAKPVPAEEPLGLRLREASPQEDGPDRAATPAATGTGLRDRLSALGQSVTASEAAHLRALDGAVRAAEGKASAWKAAVAETGLLPQVLAQTKAAGLGGPLVPMAGDAAPDPFDTLGQRLRASLLALRQIRQAAAALPFGRPTGEGDVTSGFGYRLDPFTRGPAMHTGLDFRGDHGDPVRATGAGRVVTAEPSGGYGNMVEVDHGLGLTTRYAHLSALTVAAGQTVTAGTVLGRVGSTGRSTGPHLHYETRLHGEAVDPQRFLKAGFRLAATDGSLPQIARAD